ncbi:hypothetical protein BJ944DRAFT_287858 [Cunninghamella echinulata]|nr:hypothetical protein BJ944DRAFT_287858 [Cunninghamella echinulata]
MKDLEIIEKEKKKKKKKWEEKGKWAKKKNESLSFFIDSKLEFKFRSNLGDSFLTIYDLTLLKNIYTKKKKINRYIDTPYTHTYIMRIHSLNHLQRQRLTNNLFVVVAFGAVVTVALPTLFPCPAFDHHDKAARLEAQRKIKEKKVIVNARPSTPTPALSPSSS